MSAASSSPLFATRSVWQRGTIVGSSSAVARRHEFAAACFSRSIDGLRRGRAVVVGEIEEQDRGVGRAGDVGDEGLVVVGGDRRQVDELHAQRPRSPSCRGPARAS